MACEAVPPLYVVAAVALAVMSPKEWHDVFLDVIRKRYDVGPGGSATEEGDLDE